MVKGLLLFSRANTPANQPLKVNNKKVKPSIPEYIMKKIKTGIYGGSFNPIHNGHIAIARKMIELAGLDEVWLMVSPQNPLKHSADLLDEQLRLDMTRIALEPYPQLKACDYEFHLPRPSYMWHTLQSLTRDYPEREFTLLIGADNWAVFDRWYHADDIIAHYPIAIYPRTGYPIDTARLPQTVKIFDTGLYDVSSTLVRQYINEGKDITRLIPSEITALAQQYYKCDAKGK